MNGWLRSFTSDREQPRLLRWHPRLEPLEDRTLLTTPPLLTALTTQRSWITYTPSTLAGDDYNCAPSEALVTKDLQTLYQEGWRGLVTYNLLGAYSDIPRIAKEVGFQYVIAGLYHVNPDSPATCGFDNPHQEELNNATNPAIAQHIDGFMVGNEGLGDGRYTIEQLTTQINAIWTNPNTQGKPVTTSERSDAYLNASDFRDQLRTIGDWWFPNSNFYCWNNAPEDPHATWNNVGYAYNQLQLAAQPLGKTVVYHESWYPTGPADQPLATQQNQVAYYQLMANGQSQWFTGPFYFVWGEAFDQSWKTGEACDQGPYWGLHANDPTPTTRQPKQIISALQSVYTSNYGATTHLTGARLVQNPNGRGKVLVVGGTATHDKIELNQRQGLVEVSINSFSFGKFAVEEIQRVQVFGFEGNDKLRSNARLVSVFDGGPGHDRLQGIAGRTWFMDAEGTLPPWPRRVKGGLASGDWAEVFLNLAREDREGRPSTR